MRELISSAHEITSPLSKNSAQSDNMSAAALRFEFRILNSEFKQVMV
jgi:hypothetical protein